MRVARVLLVFTAGAALGLSLVVRSWADEIRGARWL